MKNLILGTLVFIALTLKSYAEKPQNALMVSNETNPLQFPNTTPGILEYCWDSPVPNNDYYVETRKCVDAFGQPSFNALCPLYNPLLPLAGLIPLREGAVCAIAADDGVQIFLDINNPANHNVWFVWSVKTLATPPIFHFPMPQGSLYSFAIVTPAVTDLKFDETAISGNTFRLTWTNNSAFQQQGEIFKFPTEINNPNQPIFPSLSLSGFVNGNSTNIANVLIPTIPSGVEYTIYKCKVYPKNLNLGWFESTNSAIIYFSNGDEGNSTLLPNEENWNELKQEKIIYGDLWISNSNFFIGEPTDATRLEVYKKVTIQNSKTLQIAGNSNSNIKITSQTGGFVVKNTSALDFYANANFEKNSFLTLESGSTLTLQDEAEIHVTEGSTLTYDGNATVNFGVNSKIFIENGGKLVLKNGNFTLNPANWVLNGGIVIDEAELSLNSFPDFEILTKNKKEQ